MDKLIRNSTAEFLIFTSQSGEDSIKVKVFDESVWLAQNMIAKLFDLQRPAATKHLKNIFESEELEEDAVSSILEHTASDGKNYKTKYYNLLLEMENNDEQNHRSSSHFIKIGITNFLPFLHSIA